MRQARITTTTLQVVSGSNALTATTRMPSPAAQQAQAALAFAVRAWAALDDPTQLKWNVAAGKWAAQLGLPNNGCAAFKSLVITKLLMGSDPAFTKVPDVPDSIPKTPDFTVTATLTPGGVFQLRILSAAADGPFLIAATASQTSGTSRIRDSQYRVLEIDDNLAAGGTSITNSYLSAMLLTPSLGTKVWVQITPLTPNGFRGTAVAQYAIVAPPPALEVTE